MSEDQDAVDRVAERLAELTREWYEQFGVSVHRHVSSRDGEPQIMIMAPTAGAVLRQRLGDCAWSVVE